MRFYEEPPTKRRLVETSWTELVLTADDWAKAFEAAESGTPHNEAREQVWDELLTILVDKNDSDATDDQLRCALQGNCTLLAAFNNAWPVLEAATWSGTCGPSRVPAARRATAHPRPRPAGGARPRRAPGPSPTSRSSTRPGSASATRGCPGGSGATTPRPRLRASRWRPSSTTCSRPTKGRR